VKEIGFNLLRKREVERSDTDEFKIGERVKQAILHTESSKQLTSQGSVEMTERQMLTRSRNPIHSPDMGSLTGRTDGPARQTMTSLLIAVVSLTGD